MNKGEVFYQQGRRHIACREYEHALECYENAADNHDHGEACYEVGRAWKYGYWGLQQNDSLASLYFERGISEGHPGCWYEKLLEEQDELEDEEIYRAIESSGHADWISLVRALQKYEERDLVDLFFNLMTRVPTPVAGVVMHCSEYAGGCPKQLLVEIASEKGWGDAQEMCGGAEWHDVAVLHGYLDALLSEASRRHCSEAFVLVKRAFNIHGSCSRIVSWLNHHVCGEHIYEWGHVANWVRFDEARSFNAKLKSAFQHYQEEHPKRVRNVLLCLCAYKFDRGSLFSKLPRDVLVWLLKTHVL